MIKLRKKLILLSVILWSGVVCFSQIGEVHSQSNPSSSWNIHFSGDFSKLNEKTGRLFGTYSIIFQKYATTPSTDTMPLVRILSPSEMHHDFGLGFDRDDSQESYVRYHRVLPTDGQDEINLTSFRQMYPWDHCLTGFVIVVNETLSANLLSFSNYVEFSSEIKDVWKVSITMEIMDPSSVYSPFDEFTSEYIVSVSDGWDSFSVLFLRISFERSETMTIFYSSWIPALAMLAGIAILWGSFFYFRRSNTISVTASGILLTGSVAFYSIFLSRDPPPGTHLNLLFVIDSLLGIGPVVFFSFLALRHDEPRQSEHMRILREQVIDPWIALLKGQDSNVATISGQIEIEGSIIGRLFLNDEFHVKSSRDPEFRFFREFTEHLKDGYGRKFRLWTSLKEEWIRSLELAKKRIELLQKDLTERITKETNLQNSKDHRSCESPTALYFHSSRLAYLIYQDIYSNVEQTNANFDHKFSIIQNPGSSDMYHVSRVPFPYLAQGSRRDCERIVAVMNELIGTSKHEKWMKNHNKKVRELRNNFADFLGFLENLSKLIENKKMLKGRCKLCS